MPPMIAFAAVVAVFLSVYFWVVMRNDRTVAASATTDDASSQSSRPVVILDQRDWCGFKVAGCRYHQGELVRIFGPYRRVALQLRCDAAFEREPGNVEDSDAVAVKIEGRLVGRFPRHDAAAFSAWMRDNQVPIDAMFPCRAYVYGGRRTNQHDETPYYVSINYQWPPRILEIRS